LSSTAIGLVQTAIGLVRTAIDGLVQTAIGLVQTAIDGLVQVVRKDNVSTFMIPDHSMQLKCRDDIVRVDACVMTHIFDGQVSG